MTCLSKLVGATLVVGGMLTIGSSLLQAQSGDAEGIIRISDCHPGPSGPAGCPEGNCPSAAGCPSGACPTGGCPTGCRKSCCIKPCRCCRHCVYGFLSWLDPHGKCTYSPDHGWSPPGKVAIWRKPVAYHKFYPDAWTGQSTGAPEMRARHILYPTDTTQLGYYYQHVPYWQPNPGMYPPAPNPNDWHQPLCGAANGICETGLVYEGSTVSEPAGAVPSDAPKEAAPLPPEPVSALNAGDLFRAGAPSLQPTPPAAE
ncbi:MAG: hypothetical protein KF774_02090 [Planctomyces sp.]|nr:hypothetical protein [Planctomyces sp.]